jgi:superfamily II DNA/RNA helicase
MNIKQSYVKKAIEDLGFTKFTEVQNLVILLGVARQVLVKLMLF